MNKFDIHERIFEFIVLTIPTVEKLPKNNSNLIFINQVVRSVTSMGANDQEADGSLTTKEFLHNYSIVRREGKETLFWLRVISKINPSYSERFEPLIKECNEIVSIVSTIIKNTSSKNK